MIIAVDFDGTLVEQKYPKVGKEIPFAIETLKMLQAKQHRLILWTYRAGDKLDEAVEFCKSRGVEFYAINKNYPEEIFDESISRKIKADMYIDDMNYGGLPDWGEIYADIVGLDSNGVQVSQIKRKNGFARLFSKD
ncbi:BT0820 family HAD-type phosphatase [Ancylomarina sp. 16SWW S1-10-2]|uniref:BT0820 family HAD-type phosphatase n=1 Tax=Ancylomarina sp. 16SWW S1-10-2 TaxID=2499681 RepID=UPI0012ADFB87|nr:hydrolase [Ancylomarina sp. 16SWW S1-10-2]MRT91934.1 hydrolase [Ancylomarina sp. 16SWW S1-10-2]